MPRPPTARYVRLMNGRYDAVLRAVAGIGATLSLDYDGTGWTATVSSRRAAGFSVTGETMEIALRAVESELGLPPGGD